MGVDALRNLDDFGAFAWYDNLAVIHMAVQTSRQPLSVGVLHEWHGRLMRNRHLPKEMVGAFRPALGWVGGTSPLDAAYVPPPPAETPHLVDDLLRFADATDDLDELSRAAIAHAQFEAIHPYGDGNGRLGRVLVSRILRRADATQRSVAPISMAVARDPGGYLSGLRTFCLPLCMNSCLVPDRGPSQPSLRKRLMSSLRATGTNRRLIWL